MGTSGEKQYIDKEKIYGTSSQKTTKESSMKIIEQLEHCICEIYDEKGNFGTGFFCKIPYSNEEKCFPALITSNHVLNKKINISQNRKIFTYNRNLSKWR